MGTRNLTMVIDKEGTTKVAQYGQHDGYPSVQGKKVLEFLLYYDIKRFEQKIEFLTFFTKEEWAHLMTNHTDNGYVRLNTKHSRYWRENWHHLDRSFGAGILAEIDKGHISKLVDGSDFVKDSLSCEWGYVIDFQKRTFEVYEGLNTTPLKKGERFEYLQQTYDELDYYPIKLVKEYSLDKLPTHEEFLNDFSN